MKNKYDFVVAVAGCPNVGKSTLFNVITGEKQHVGNWPGKTVERYEGTLFHHGYRIKVVDLPGTYSLGALSEEEVIARDFIVKDKPDVVIVIADALRLEHTLYLVIQLLELTEKVVVALNKMDAADKRGIHIRVDRLAGKLSVPVIPISALHKIGINNLVDRVLEIAEGKIKPRKFRLNYGGIEYYID
ncbi:MAG TPA: GTP-binding protein, partial [Thermoprotei archaeon]|nr:GTP-binding protein [Thermoprotei archaeon]